MNSKAFDEEEDLRKVVSLSSRRICPCIQTLIGKDNMFY